MSTLTFKPQCSDPLSVHVLYETVCVVGCITPFLPCEGQMEGCCVFGTQGGAVPWRLYVWQMICIIFCSTAMRSSLLRWTDTHCITFLYFFFKEMNKVFLNSCAICSLHEYILYIHANPLVVLTKTTNTFSSLKNRLSEVLQIKAFTHLQVMNRE